MSMSTAVTRSAAFALLATLSAALVGCTQVTPGSPSVQGSASSVPPSSASTAPGKAVDQLDPCQLIDASTAAQLGLPAGQRDDLDGEPGCKWQVPGSYVMGIDLSDKLGVNDLNVTNGSLSTVPIGRHDGRKVEADGGPGQCAIAIAITDSSRVLAGVHARRDTAKACDVARRVANAIEPKLP